MNLGRKVEYRVLEKLDEQGRLLRREWQDPVSQAPHRIGGPAVQKFSPETGMVTGEIWLNRRKGGRHRENNLPAEISIDPTTGVIVIEQYFERNQLHRDDGGPAQIYRDGDTGHITLIAYMFEGWMERDSDLPALLEFSHLDGSLRREKYYRRNQLHRTSGPAVVEYDNTGEPITASLRYYLNGSRVDAFCDPDMPSLD